MIKVYVDSGSSIKQTEKDKLNVEIMPLKIIFENKEYLDGINLSFEEFYYKLINDEFIENENYYNKSNNRANCVCKCFISKES